MLGRSVVGVQQDPNDEDTPLRISLEGEDVLSARAVTGRPSDLPATGSNALNSPSYIARSISIVSSPLASLFPAMGENGPSPAGCVVVFPHYLFEEVDVPVYLVVHSSDAGECPKGQCKSTLFCYLASRVMIKLKNTYLHYLNSFI